MTIIWIGKPKIIENMVLMYQWERSTHILYTPFPVIIENRFSCTNRNGVHIFCIHRSRYCMTINWSGKPKIIENMVLMYQWERCTHILYTPFPFLYDYNLEWKTENYRKYGSHVPMGTVYTHSVYTVPLIV